MKNMDPKKITSYSVQSDKPILYLSTKLNENDIIQLRFYSFRMKVLLGLDTINQLNGGNEIILFHFLIQLNIFPLLLLLF